jgi:septum formation protein
VTIHAPRLLLASASPARLETLRRAGLDPEVVVSDVDESGVSAATPAATAQLLAEMKARAVADRLGAAGAARLVLGCDSLLEFDGAALGKPGTPQVAIERWRRMRGRAGVLHTGHCLIETASGGTESAVASTTVYFADVSDSEIAAYVATGEPLAVAGHSPWTGSAERSWNRSRATTTMWWEFRCPCCGGWWRPST